MEELDIHKLNTKNSKNIKIGELSPEVIKLLNLDLKPQNINVWSTRIEEHCQKHKDEYSSSEAFEQAVKNIPLILSQPDYIGLHKNGNIQYIKQLDDISLIGIQIIKDNSGLLFRTIFPITKGKLDYSVKTGKFIPYKK